MVPARALTAVMCSKHAPVVAWSATGLAATFAQPPGWVRGPPPMLIGLSMSLSHVWMLLAFAHSLGRVSCVLLSALVTRTENIPIMIPILA
jgi:hypothetical protein